MLTLRDTVVASITKKKTGTLRRLFPCWRKILHKVLIKRILQFNVNLLNVLWRILQRLTIKRGRCLFIIIWKFSRFRISCFFYWFCLLSTFDYYVFCRLCLSFADFWRGVFVFCCLRVMCKPSRRKMFLYCFYEKWNCYTIKFITLMLLSGCWNCRIVFCYVIDLLLKSAIVLIEVIYIKIVDIHILCAYCKLVPKSQILNKISDTFWLALLIFFSLIFFRQFAWKYLSCFQY